MNASTRAPLPYAFLPAVSSFTVSSGDIADGEPLKLPQFTGMFDVGGEDISPQLSWSGFPPETKSFAVTCLDPDAPTGSGFWHWAVADIPAGVTSLPAGAGTPDADGLPAGAVTVRNDAGTVGYLGGGPPPPGDEPHRYVFAVHAVDVEHLGVDAGATPAFLGFNLTMHTLARGLLIATSGP